MDKACGNCDRAENPNKRCACATDTKHELLDAEPMKINGKGFQYCDQFKPMLTRRIMNIHSIGDIKMQKTFTATDLKRNTSDLFNAVQSLGAVKITNKLRPEMVIMLKDSHDVIVATAKEQSEKIRQLTGLIQAHNLKG